MSHELEAIEAPLRDLPHAVEIGFAFVTHFGDTWFVLVVAGALYLFADRWPLPEGGYDRHDGAVLLALVVAAMGTIVGLKTAFAHPRPPGAGPTPDLALLPGALQTALGPLARADGYAFPSGHALQSTVFYGGLALTVSAGRRWQRALAAATVVGLIALSRVIIGVHYLLDVVAGVLAGGVLLAAIWAVAAARPGRALLIAVAVALGAVVVAGFGVTPLAILGGAIGGRLTWGVVGGDVPSRPASRRDSRQLVAFGIPILVGLVGLTLAMELGGDQPWAVVAAFVVSGGLLGALIALPVAVTGSSRGEGRAGRPRQG